MQKKKEDKRCFVWTLKASLPLPSQWRFPCKSTAACTFLYIASSWLFIPNALVLGMEKVNKKKSKGKEKRAFTEDIFLCESNLITSWLSGYIYESVLYCTSCKTPSSIIENANSIVEYNGFSTCLSKQYLKNKAVFFFFFSLPIFWLLDLFYSRYWVKKKHKKLMKISWQFMDFPLISWWN